MTKTTTPKTRKLTVQPNILPTMTRQAAQDGFAKDIGRPDDNGGNSYLAKFLLIMSDLQNEKASFTMTDIRYAARPYDIPHVALQELAEKWIQWMNLHHKITLVVGCYENEPVICVV